jgi:hypothetical protein
MNNPREPFERLLDVFEDTFKRIAEQEEFAFDPRPHQVGLALRLKHKRLKRGVFLDLKAHWMKSDPVDPEVVLQYGAWAEAGLPVLFRIFYDGRLSELTKCIEEKLKLAVSQLKMVSEEMILREGKSHEGLLREARTRDV